jgi:uncharacterized protein YndB with AHSA1/START domain
MKRKQIQVEFLFKASPSIIYKFLTDPSCLVRWFCDKVNILEDTYVFGWRGGEPEEAVLIMNLEDELVRYDFDGSYNDGEYLEFKITESPITQETILFVTDFVDEGDEKDQTDLWITLMEKLKSVTGG